MTPFVSGLPLLTAAFFCSNSERLVMLSPAVAALPGV
jgi:hypothetical protein